jgi:carbamoyltransferase
MYILGINAYHGDSSAALLHNGELVAAVEEERFRRIKHWAGFPSESIRYCLEHAGIGVEQLDHIALSFDPKANVGKKALLKVFMGAIWFLLLYSLRLQADVAIMISQMWARRFVAPEELTKL